MAPAGLKVKSDRDVGGTQITSPSLRVKNVVCGMWDATATFRKHPKPLPSSHSLASCSSRRSGAIITALLLATAVAVGFLGGALFFRAGSRSSSSSSSSRESLRLAAPDHPYAVLSSAVWRSTPWGSNCSGLAGGGRPHSKGLQSLCRLPSIWRDCSGGIYLDVGSNVGVQIRKLYDPHQFPGAPVLELFAATYGLDRSRVCSIGIEANPNHTPYLQVLNAYFRRKGHQAVVLTEVAASNQGGQVTFYSDPGSESEWGAGLVNGWWLRKNAGADNAASVPLLDLPAFLSELIHPLVLQIQWATGRRPPVGMKMDVEGEEYAILPGLITSGGLCQLDMLYLEAHKQETRTERGKVVDMTIPRMEKVFFKLRKANPGCRVQYSHLDDETYLHADTEVPLSP